MARATGAVLCARNRRVQVSQLTYFTGHARRHGSRSASIAISLLLTSTPTLAADALRLAQVQELSHLSLDELIRVEVTSVSKAPQQLSTAPAAIYVITAEEIERAGVRSIPEALRLAPNLQVAQLTSAGYAITARGFGDNREVQTQANKLLILVDGRTVYSPLFSGIFYDAIDVVMDDIDRIEVISGPGATLWGANAMNGVINIITRPAAQTEGTLVRLESGTSESAATARLGGRIGENLTYRVYGKAFDRHALELQNGDSAEDRWNKRQGGFRLDWQRAQNALTVQGDVYGGDQSILGGPDLAMTGTNILARWQHTTQRSQLSVQAYYDRSEREAPSDGAAFSLDSYDVEVQQSIALGSAHRIVWGAGKRVNNYYVPGNGQLQFNPKHRSLDQGNLFLQDTLALGSAIKLTAGVKAEDNPYSGWTLLPDVRLSWEPNGTALLWAAASKAIRAPTPFDVDVAEFLGATLFLRGNPTFHNESLSAYEVGYRGRPMEKLSLSVSAFYDDYGDLRTIELSPTGLPLIWENRMEGHTYGVEAWANVQITPWWRLSPGFRSLHKRLRFEEGSSKLVGLQLAGNDPTHGAALKSSMSLGERVTLDAFLRHVAELPNPNQPDYYDLSARVGWRVSNTLQVAVSGFNLLHERHPEYPTPQGLQIERSVFAEMKLRF
jgi:iron complex outermembrane receptor protein